MQVPDKKLQVATTEVNFHGRPVRRNKDEQGFLFRKNKHGILSRIEDAKFISQKWNEHLQFPQTKQSIIEAYATAQPLFLLVNQLFT